MPKQNKFNNNLKTKKESRPQKERLSFLYLKNQKPPQKKVTQTETIWVILVNSSTPIKYKDILFLYSLSSEI